jgi:hypothetical protein
MIKQKVCPKCGYDVYIKADLSWDEVKQNWEVVWTNDQISCARCHNEFRIKDIKDVM